MAVEWLKGAGDSIGSVTSGASGDAWFAKLGGAGSVLTQAILVLIIVIGIILVIRKMMMFNIDVYVFKKYSNGVKLVKRKGRLRKAKDGRYHFDITKPSFFNFQKKEVAMPDQTHFIKKKKGDAIFLYQISAEDYKPIMLEEALSKDNEATMNLSIMDLNASNHAIQMHKEVITKELSKNKALIYLPTILMVGGMIFVVVLLWMTLGRIETMNAAMTSGYKLMANAVSSFGQQVIN